MMEIERPKIETASLSPDGRYGKFVAEPLERGFGITLGNSLRRVLLSSLPGVAVTSVKIDGVVHEFSTIEGVKEDVTEIVLNLKGIAAKLYTDGPKTVRVEAVGPCEVTADNIKQGDDIEILNPEWHIATLGEGGKLVMNDFDHQFLRLDGVDNVLTDSLCLDGVGKSLGYFVVDVGVKERAAHILQCFRYINLGDFSLTFQNLKRPFQSLT